MSYRRDDIPGYVRQLQEDLQRYFGEETVFRDVEDIAGGQHWREVLANNLAQSAALIVVIGPRWEQIWNEREDKANDFIVYELNKARELGVTIIPVTINGTVFSKGMDLGPIDWLMEKQIYDISDKQGRWPTDIIGLVNILEREKNLVRRKQKNKKSFSKLLLIPLVLVVLAVIGFLGEQDSGQYYNNTDLEPLLPVAANPVEFPNPVPAPALPTEPAEPIPSLPDLAAPDIAGYWRDDEGAVFQVTETVDGYFYMHPVNEITEGVFAPNYLDWIGTGQFIPNLPGKFKLYVEGYGQGEYSVTTDNARMAGWFYINETGETLYGTLSRVSDGT